MCPILNSRERERDRERVGGKDISPEAIPPEDDPSILIPGADTRLADNIDASEVGKTFGVPDDAVPYPDTYWPFVDEGIDAQWNGVDPSPLEKYMGVTYPA